MMDKQEHVIASQLMHPSLRHFVKHLPCIKFVSLHPSQNDIILKPNATHNLIRKLKV